MSDTQLVVLSLADEDSAVDLVRQLDAIDKLDENVNIVDAAIAVKSGSDKVKLRQLKVAGATKGGIVGAISSAFGGLASVFRDAGIDDDMMRRTAQDLKVGAVALFILYTGDWNRSSAVLQDALSAHGIRYVDQSMPSSMVAAVQSASDDLTAEELEEGFEVEIAEPVPEGAVAIAAVAEETADPEPEAADEDEPYFGEDSVEDFVDEEDDVTDEASVASAAAATEDAGAAAVADASRAALVAAASDATRAVDAEVVAGKVAAMGDAVGTAGAMDTRQGVEMLDASSAVGDAGASMGLLSLERRYSGLELGRIAGELAQVGQEVGEQDMPILSAILGVRSERLQEIAAQMVASAATARELASVLESTGGQVGDLGVNEVDEGAARLTAASALTARAAEIGAAGLALADRADEELAMAAGDSDRVNG